MAALVLAAAFGLLCGPSGCFLPGRSTHNPKDGLEPTEGMLADLPDSVTRSRMPVLVLTNRAGTRATVAWADEFNQWTIWDDGETLGFSQGKGILGVGRSDIPALIHGDSKQQGVWWNGGMAKYGYDEVTALAVNADGTHMAFAGVRDGKNYLVVDLGEERERPGKISQLAVDSDGKLAEVAKEGAKSVLYRDGVKAAEYESIRYLQFGPDGKTLCFIAGDSTSSFIVSGNQTGAVHQRISLMFFRPDGGEIGYVAADGANGWFVVAGTWKSPAYEEIRNAAYSGDGSRVAYVAFDESRRVIVGLGERVMTTSFVYPAGLYAVDHQGTAAVISVQDSQQRGRLAVNDRLLDEETESLAAPVFAPNGDVARVIGKKGNAFVVCGAVRSPAVDEVFTLGAAPKANAIVYIARDGKRIVRRVLQLG